MSVNTIQASTQMLILTGQSSDLKKKRSKAVISSCKGDQLTVLNNSVKHCGGENNSVCFTSKIRLRLLSALYTNERPRAKSAAGRLLSLVNF